MNTLFGPDEKRITQIRIAAMVLGFFLPDSSAVLDDQLFTFIRLA